ncbi:cytochrome oxidase assembly protein Shy1p [Diutina catenulata]
MLLGPSQRFLGSRGWSRLRGSPRTVRTPVRSVKTSTVDWKPVRAVEGNLTTLEHQAKTPWLRRFFLGLMIAMPVISFTLGCWQVRRLRWKADLIAKCENNLAAETIPELPAQLDPDAIAEFEYRRFRCKGHFDYSQEMFLGPRMRDGHLGYLVVTPFVREAGGKPILVERGWISKEKVVPSTRDHGYLSHLALPQGEIEIEALFRVMPERSNLQFEHEPGSRLFNVHDVPAMSEQAGTLPIYAQMIYDMHDHPEYQGPDATKEKPSLLNKLLFKSSSDSEFMKNHDDDETMVYQPFEFVQQGVPIAAMPKLKFSNNHLQYLITWFGLSIGSAGLLLWSFMKKGKYSSADKVIEAKRRDMRQNF